MVSACRETVICAISTNGATGGSSILPTMSSGGSVREFPLRSPHGPGGRVFWITFGPFLVGHAMSRYVSRSMSRTKIPIETSSHRLKRGESTLHSELRRFFDFHNLRIQGGRDPFGLQFDFRNFRALERPGRAGRAGRTRVAKFHSNGQPSVAMTQKSNTIH